MKNIRTIQEQEPDLDDVLGALRDNIFKYMNCVQIGKIESYNKDEQTVSVQLQIKRRVSETETVRFPLLVDCPVFVLQGGGAYIDMPIATGDFCIVLFNDQDIDNWWDGGLLTDANTERRHDLSDGMALVGINPKGSVLGLTGDKIGINAGTKPVEIKGSKIDMLGATESFMKSDTWKTNWTALNTTVQTATTGTAAQNAAGITTIKTAFATFSAQLSNMLSTTIKGE